MNTKNVAQQTMEPNNPVLPDHVSQELHTLKNRANNILRNGKIIFVGGVLTSVIAAAAMLVAHLFGLDAHLTALDIPESVKYAMSTLPSAASSGDLTDMQGNIADIVGLLTSPLVKVMSVISIVVAGLYTALGTMKGRVMILPLLFASATMFIQFIAPTTVQSSSNNSSLEQLASSGQYGSMADVMTKANVPTVLQDYVIAQAIVVKSEKDGANIPSKDMANAIARLKSIDASVEQSHEKESMSGEVLYALENTLIGKTASKPAQEYYGSRKGLVANAEYIASIMIESTLISFLAGGLVMLFGYRMRARIKRIKALTVG